MIDVFNCLETSQYPQTWSTIVDSDVSRRIQTLMDSPTPTPDLSTWKTKTEAATLLRVSEKTIERMAVDGESSVEGKVRRAFRRIPGRRDLPVYHPADLAKIAGTTIEATPIDDNHQTKLPAIVRKVSKSLGNERMDMMRPQDRTALLSAMAEAEVVPVHMRLYLSIDEAIRYSGLGRGYLEKLIQGGKLELLKGAGPNGSDVICRADLERL